MRINFAIFALFALAGVGVALAADRAPRRRAEPRVATRFDNRVDSKDSEPADREAPASTRPQAIVAQAVRQIDAHETITANVRQKIDLFGRQLIGKGTYVQEGRGVGRRLRWDLQIVADQVSSMQQVCDGEYLWIHQQLLGQSTLGRVDVTKVRLALNERSSTPTPSLGGFPLGGLPRLLQSLEASFQFTSCGESQLGDHLGVWVIEGEWKPAALAELLGEKNPQKGTPSNLDASKLPAHVPDRVILMLGRDDLFPYRLEYWRTGQADPKKKEPAQDKLLVTMEFILVQFDAQVDPRQFEVYKRGSAEGRDITPEYLKSLGLAEVASH